MIRCSCHGLQGWVPVAASATPKSAARENSRARKSRWRARASAKSIPLPERISISDRISSPEIDSARASSEEQESRSSSKRCTSESVSGSRIANSSSIPTVKSSEASKTSRVFAMSSIGLGEVEVERVEQVDGGTRSVHRHLRRHLEQRLGVVEDDPDPRLDQVVGDLLGGIGGYRQHPDHDLLGLDHRGEVL